MRNCVITGADRGVGSALTAEMLSRGLRVFAGQYMPEWPELDALKEKYGDQLTILPLDVSKTESVFAMAKAVAEYTDTVDMVINVAGISGRDPELGNAPDIANMVRVFQTNSVGPMRMVNAFLPLMEKGEKRLAFVSSEAGSIACDTRGGYVSYPMSKTALNSAVKLMFNDLQPKGFKFRLYHPGWVRSYMSGKKSTMGTVEPEETAIPLANQILEDRDWEDSLILLDNEGRAWPF